MTDDDATASEDAPIWRIEVDALAFRPEGHRGVCMVHRHAFRTLLRHYPSPEECGDFFRQHVAIFQAAAHEKIERAAVPVDANFHLTSRDLSRQMQN